MHKAYEEATLLEHKDTYLPFNFSSKSEASIEGIVYTSIISSTLFKLFHW